MTPKKPIGSWTQCINPFDNPVKHFFFRGTQLPNDIAKICPICWYEAKKKNGTLKSAYTRIGTDAQISHGAKCTPEADSL
jgi:hypothetical protein